MFITMARNQGRTFAQVMDSILFGTRIACKNREVAERIYKYADQFNLGKPHLIFWDKDKGWVEYAERG